MACEEIASSEFHRFIDGELTNKEVVKLKHHMMSCGACQAHYRELKQVHDELTIQEKVVIPINLKENVLKELPRYSRAKRFKLTIKEHPLITAAALFFIVLIIHTITQYNSEYMNITEHEGVIYEEDYVIIPEGLIIEGDIIVKNKNLILNGEIKGNLTLINSEIISDVESTNTNMNYYAYSGRVQGKIIEVHQFFGWVTYRIQEGFENIITFVTE